MQKKVIRRLALLGTVVLVIFFGYLYRLMQMQIAQGAEYLAQAEAGTTRQQLVKAARGEIVDRYGRPFAVNRSGYNIVLDGAYLPAKNEANRVILRLMDLLEECGEEWIDQLPVSMEAPFAFEEGREQEVEQLKKMFDLNEYSTCEDVMYWVVRRYQLGEYDQSLGRYVLRDDKDETVILASYTPKQMRRIAGVRYGMELMEFGVASTYTFAEDVDISTVSRVKERDFEMPGVSVEESANREYVSGDLAPHIIGQVGRIYKEEYAELKNKGYRMNDMVGKEGIEKYFEDYLRGKDGTRQITLDSRGNVVSVEETEPAVPGNTVVLTLDKDLQRVAQDALEKQIKHLQQTAPEGEGREANAGAVVVIENKTGDILACATYPSYNINEYRSNYSQLLQDTANPLWNRALMGAYSAGSTFKPAVAIAGLSEGEITGSESIYCGGVYTELGSYQPRCLYVNGPITVRNALQVSCNIFFYETGLRLGIERLNHYCAQFGLGEPTGIEIAENIGHLSSPDVKERVEPGTPWFPADTVQSAIGQLYNQFTPLQLANYAATIGNRGRRMDVNIVRSVKTYNMDETVWENEPSVAQQVEATPQAFEVTIQGMEMATGPGGTSYEQWGDYPMTIASKTGTPETKAFPNSTYICFGPSDDPEISVAVVIEKGWHGYTGAPVAKAIFDAYFFDVQNTQAPMEQGVLLP
ncbi:MAG: penicillin-binding protein [Oscillospiraceae bacterium]|nr:penicillin-binding protein [Oscillospiraceae bacterium]